MHFLIISVAKILGYFMVVGGLIAAGMIMSFYGSQIVTEDLQMNETVLSPNDSFELFSELDSEISKTGVWVIQVEKFEEGTISAEIFDPFDSLIDSQIVPRDSFEQKFEIISTGSYKLVIENSGSQETQIITVLGHMPDSSKLSLGITGFYILIIGLLGIVGVGIYAYRNRRE